MIHKDTRTHIIIGDTQQKPGVRNDHMAWIGRYFVDQFAGRNVALIHLGDHWDMPSLSSYDKGKKSSEGRRYVADIAAGNLAFDLLNEPLYEYNKKRKVKWNPGLHITLGNHEDRIARACEDNAELDGALSLDDLNAAEWGWKVHPYKSVLKLDGVSYSHFFYNPKTGKPFAGENLHTRLKQIGYSFTMGHQQGLNYAFRPVGDTWHHGLVNGSTYLHDEHYLGPQGNQVWRGIVVCHQVENGAYDAMFVSLDFLCRKYTGKPLKKFLGV